MIEAVTLDATRTLFEPRDLGGDYSRVLARHGIDLAPAETGRFIAVVWQELSCLADPSRDRFASAPGGSRGFWWRFLVRLCELAGVGPPTRFAAAELFERFAEADAYRVYDDVVPALEELRAAGLRLAVISNWDERLARVLAGLGLASYFEAIHASAVVGVEKPHRKIFETALAGLGMPAERALHVGDSALDDVEGARAVGLHALWLVRDGAGDLARLTELPERLAAFA